MKIPTDTPYDIPSYPRIMGLVLVMLQGCDSGQTADDCDAVPQPETIGPLLYEAHDCSPVHLCGKATLYRDGDRVQILEFDADGTVVGEARGTLVPAFAQQLDEVIAAIVDGGVDLGGFDPVCLHLPPIPIVLSLPATFEAVEFRHPRGCGPAGLVPLEWDLHGVLSRLRDCEGDGSVEVDYCHFDAKPNR